MRHGRRPAAVDLCTKCVYDADNAAAAADPNANFDAGNDDSNQNGRAITEDSAPPAAEPRTDAGLDRPSRLDRLVLLRTIRRLDIAGQCCTVRPGT